jgi:hypothetical protein
VVLLDIPAVAAIFIHIAATADGFSPEFSIALVHRREKSAMAGRRGRQSPSLPRCPFVSA